MMRSLRTTWLLLLLSLLALSKNAYSQEGDDESGGAYAYSEVDYDSASNTVIAYSETDLDDSLVGDYEPQVTGKLYKDGTLIQSLTDRGYDGDDYASVTLEVVGTPDSTYEMDGRHMEIAAYSDYDLQQRYYYDPNDFGYWSTQGVDELWSFAFITAGQLATRPTQNIPLGSTYDIRTLSGSCGDERDDIISEYHTAPHVTSLLPKCADFVQSAATQHYGWGNYNSGDYSWAIVRSTLSGGAENVVTNYGSAPVWNSGYRNPAKEYSLALQQQTAFTKGSRHMAGDAVDFASNASTWQSIHDAGKLARGCVEPLTYQKNNPAHVHIDWRGACPPTGW